MNTTRASLLQRAQGGADTAAWPRLVALYQPLLRSWLHRCQVPHHDVDDLVQEVLAVVVRELPHFKHPGHAGAFRGWLRAILANRMKSFWRAGRCRPQTGDEHFLELAERMATDDHELSRLWDQEHDAHVLGRLLELIDQEFEPTTVQAFRQVTLAGQKAEAVAADLGISVAAVYIAKSRVLRRLREEAAGLVEC
jgi:RNA polymerase sigma-70 factor (ECF subfamily)